LRFDNLISCRIPRFVSNNSLPYREEVSWWDTFAGDSSTATIVANLSNQHPLTDIETTPIPATVL
jgi:hypothetical protein